METVVVVYLVYILVSIAMTVWVARTLYVNGIQFLVDAFGGNEDLAASWNHLLVVGFYLVNFGFMALNLKVGGQHYGVREGIELVMWQLGLVMVVLGAMHFANL